MTRPRGHREIKGHRRMYLSSPFITIPTARLQVALCANPAGPTARALVGHLGRLARTRVCVFWRFTSCTRHAYHARGGGGGGKEVARVSRVRESAEGSGGSQTREEGNNASATTVARGGLGDRCSEREAQRTGARNRLQPAAGGMEVRTPKREPRPSAEPRECSPSVCDTTFFPWNWGEEARNVNLSPGSSCSSPEYREQHHVAGGSGGGAGGGGGGGRTATGNGPESRRGRPRADALTNLMKQGSTSPSSIKCTYCNRVFPREKSLQAHLRTHTGNGGFLPRRRPRGKAARGFTSARASRQSAIMPRFKYLNGSPRVPATQRDASRLVSGTPVAP